MYAGGRGDGGQNRVFTYAVLGSILLHALLLTLLPGLRDSKSRTAAPPGPIVAHLAVPRAAPPPAPVAPPIAEPPPVAPPVETPPPVAKPVPQPKPAPLAKAAPVAKPAPAPVKSAPPAPSTPETAASLPPSSTPAPASSSIAKTEPQPASSAPPAAEAADAGTIAQYRLQLIGVAKRYKRYPRVAMDNNWEGTVEVRLMIGANGFISSLVVRKGTGHEVLDQEALQWIRKAKPLAPIPASLRGKEFTVDIPVIFNLKEPDA